MAEVVSNPLPYSGIMYSEKSLESMTSPYSKLKHVEPGDTCCNCGGDCDGDGFAIAEFRANRINGHPFCARGACYSARISEFIGGRDGCRCGLNRRRKNGETK